MSHTACSISPLVLPHSFYLFSDLKTLISLGIYQDAGVQQLCVHTICKCELHVSTKRWMKGRGSMASLSKPDDARLLVLHTKRQEVVRC